MILTSCSGLEVILDSHSYTAFIQILLIPVHSASSWFSFCWTTLIVFYLNFLFDVHLGLTFLSLTAKEIILKCTSDNLKHSQNSTITCIANGLEQ